MIPTHRLSRFVPWIVAVVGLLLTAAILYPGQYPFDSAYQLWQARSGHFNNQSPVAMTKLWSLMLEFSSNPATLLCLNLAMFWTGLTLCVAAVSSTALVRVLLLLIFGVAPLTLVEMAHLLTDAHLTAVLVLATGLAAWGLAEARRPPLVASLLLLLYAGAVRYNAVVAILPLGAVVAAAFTRKDRPDWRAASFAAVALAVLSFAAGLAIDRAVTVERVTVWPTIALWDLAAVSVDSDRLLLPPFTHGPDLTVDELRKPGVFDPTANTYLFQGTHTGIRDGLIEPYSSDQLRELRRAWLDAVLRNPGAYIRHRLLTFWLLVGPHRGAIYGPAYFVSRVQYRDNPPLPTALDRGAQQGFYALAAKLRPSWIFAALPYLILSVAALALGWARRNRPIAQLGAAASGGALLYAATFFPLAPAADLRYLTWPIVAGPLALALALSTRVVVERNDGAQSPTGVRQANRFCERTRYGPLA
jgi:hypothetical protein